MSERYLLRKTSGREAYHSPVAIEQRIKIRSKRIRRQKNGLISLLYTPEHLVSATRDDSTHSPLPSLPPEIRSRIWEYVLGDMCVYLTKGHVEFAPTGSKIKLTFDADLHLGVLRVCRQIYSETATTVYRMSTFHFDDYDKLSAFRYDMKRAHWEVFDTIGISFELARKIYAPPYPPPPPRGRRVMTHGQMWIPWRPPVDLFATPPNARGEYLKLSQMFPQSWTIIVDGEGRNHGVEDVLGRVQSAEPDRGVVLEQ
ncbi:hypothetical protein EK21DRAFT_84362 [Setomelanomma holmii]|uniref:DUF7730 domain-containing protein n=1 Tax=Setomelanomma holmii TaxID=210430 RepID=A0A9P4HIP4_9PLEO|nr:hypothetical protein EK21DRAFT_84362 [Setomelanomma holmii]